MSISMENKLVFLKELRKCLISYIKEEVHLSNSVYWVEVLEMLDKEIAVLEGSILGNVISMNNEVLMSLQQILDDGNYIEFDLNEQFIIVTIAVQLLTNLLKTNKVKMANILDFYENLQEKYDEVMRLDLDTSYMMEDFKSLIDKLKVVI